VNPGPQGPQGIQGPTGPQGPPGPVQTVAPGDKSVTVAGTAANPTVAVAANGINNTHIANGALNAAKIAGTSAILGSNNFVGDQNVTGHVTVGNPGGAAVDGIGFVGVRGDGGSGGFGIVGSAPANGTAGQFNGSVNVTGPLSTATLDVNGSARMVSATITGDASVNGTLFAGYSLVSGAALLISCGATGCSGFSVASCPAGTRALGGGYSTFPPSGGIAQDNRPILSATGWVVTLAVPAFQSTTLVVYAICMRV
jgi:hypothetical protein